MAKTTTPTTQSLKISRTFEASPEVVFNAWTNPEALMQWFAPSDDFSTPVAEVDLREGGHFRIQMKDPSGETHTACGVYREIRKSERLVFTWAWEEVARCGDTELGPIPETLVTVEFHHHEIGTEMVLIHEQFPTDEARDKHQQGWGGCLSHLGLFVNNRNI